MGHAERFRALLQISKEPRVDNVRDGTPAPA